MCSNRFRAGLPTLSVLVIAGTALLTGCSADRYFMVPKSDLSDMNASVQSQRATLVTMEQNATVRHDKLLEHNEAATQKVLEAISTQVAKPSCPPVQAQKACPAAENTKGRADRLKGKVVVGEVENFYLAGPGLIYKARIDSGAETSSLDARNITRFERDGSNWVRFDVPVPGTEEFVTLEKEVSRRVRVIQASADEAERRVVVELQFSIGDHQQVAEFTLADRSNLTYQALIGRNVLRDVMLIDVGKEYATELPESIRTDNGN
ncbi:MULTISPECIES: RimK/LysX family protein [unclassified Marinobacter]|uniref:ATP-dependent zinc protease family protein n=1 Tax=unclassified Marinobacter TaxID=83889 RepID=UPI0026E16D76|nr:MULTISPECIES: RimK/LysX family protein [unclassified Marinobacter]MDO6440886.1 RimK/LysX family protein [Marinobacter sp. 2_MG-2023]MDO6823714.1 RimK/LysX family protein [Marinobacter sp. 1_MG-2023]